MNARQALERWAAGGTLSRQETHALFSRLMDGELTDAVKGALLMALEVKGASTGEVAGAAAAMRQRVIRIPHSSAAAVDTCGTGGDGQGTFNISTAAALVTAAAGVPVAKHGNRSVSSRSGSADVLAALGVSLELSAEDCGHCLDDVGIAFLFAPALHAAMAEVMNVRRELGVRTIFNVLGPLTNPAAAERQLLGVFSRRWVRPLAEVLQQLGSVRAWVVHGSDGLDEITVTGPTQVAQLDGGQLVEFEISPADVGLDTWPAAALVGGDPADNAVQLRQVLAGDPGALRDVTIFNAGAAIFLGDGAASLEEGVGAAGRAIDSGRAAETLERLVAFSASRSAGTP